MCARVWLCACVCVWCVVQGQLAGKNDSQDGDYVVAEGGGEAEEDEELFQHKVGGAQGGGGVFYYQRYVCVCVGGCGWVGGVLVVLWWWWRWRWAVVRGRDEGGPVGGTLVAASCFASSLPWHFWPACRA